MTPSLLEVESLTKRFGGLTAVNKVSFRLARHLPPYFPAAQ
jgi:ABC-type branched-subunit amino acid transport system ATPase component